MRVCSRALGDIQFPQRADEANGSACTLELKSVVRRLAKVNLTSSRGHSRPPEAIGRAQRPQLRKIPNRFFAECCLPIRSERTGPGCEQDRNRASRYSEWSSKKHSLDGRSCLQPSACQRMISSVQKNTREFTLACIFEIRGGTSGFRWSCCRRRDGRPCRRLLGRSCSAPWFV